MDFQSILYSDTAPYPPVEVDAPNPQYASAILSNIGDCNSEISAVSLYFYNSLITRKNFQEIAECFHKISIVEMHHLDIFGELALKLGTDPRLWSRRKGRLHYWSPNCNRYLSGITPLISNALASEQDAVRKYRAQTQWIKDSHICAILNRIIADEEIHIHIFQSLLSELTEPAPLTEFKASIPVPPTSPISPFSPSPVAQAQEIQQAQEGDRVQVQTLEQTQVQAQVQNQAAQQVQAQTQATVHPQSPQQARGQNLSAQQTRSQGRSSQLQQMQSPNQKTHTPQNHQSIHF